MPGRPRVCVLLATHNSSAWLREQLQSVFDQESVTVSVVASDDSSCDDTPQTLSDWSKDHRLTVLPAPGERYGNAHRNFVRLIVEAPTADAEYIALSDHDDIWLAHKLSRAVLRLSETGASGYSSNVTAFWPDGRQRLIDKAQPQRTFDHLFSSPGPGCTFVLPQHVFIQLRTWILSRLEQVRTFCVHDWLIYAYVRERGLRWCIDEQSTMLYRQHEGNEMGANAGWGPAWRRVQYVRSGAYRRDVLRLADLIGHESDLVRALRRLAPMDRCWLIANVRKFRRARRDRVALALFFAFMPSGR